MSLVLIHLQFARRHELLETIMDIMNEMMEMQRMEMDETLVEKLKEVGLELTEVMEHQTHALNSVETELTMELMSVTMETTIISMDEMKTAL